MSELLETVATARFRLRELEDASGRWMTHDAKSSQLAADTSDGQDRDQFVEALQGGQSEQLLMFEALEAFLAAWARVSLLLSPTGGNKVRGQTLQAALGLAPTALLNDRALRDSWMHFDERLDKAVAAGNWGNRHRWVLSAQAAGSITNTLRLFEVDTLVVHYRDKGNHACSTNLRACGALLEEISNRWQGAWSKLP